MLYFFKEVVEALPEGLQDKARTIPVYLQTEPDISNQEYPLVDDFVNNNEESGADLMSIAWHGSPHRFDKFEMSKLGNGEGALFFYKLLAVARKGSANVAVVGLA